jgi:hypothetical protein
MEGGEDGMETHFMNRPNQLLSLLRLARGVPPLKLIPDLESALDVGSIQHEGKGGD